MKKYIFIAILSCFSFLSCKIIKDEQSKTNFTMDKLCNKWLYINNYDGVVTKIDTLKKEVKKYRFYTPSFTYRLDGSYTNYQGDYSDNGTFTLEEKTGIINCRYNMGSIKKEAKSRITYLDDEYLLIVVFENEIESRTFFYKKDTTIN